MRHPGLSRDLLEGQRSHPSHATQSLPDGDIPGRLVHRSSISSVATAREAMSAGSLGTERVSERARLLLVDVPLAVDDDAIRAAGVLAGHLFVHDIDRDGAWIPQEAVAVPAAAWQSVVIDLVLLQGGRDHRRQLLLTAVGAPARVDRCRARLSAGEAVRRMVPPVRADRRRRLVVRQRQARSIASPPRYRPAPPESVTNP